MATRVPRDLIVTWEQRLVASSPLGPAAIAAAVAAIAIVSYFAWALALGVRIVHVGHPLPLPIEPGAWSAIVLGLLAGYNVLLVHYVIAKNAEDLEALSPVIPQASVGELRGLWIESMAAARGRMLTAGALGLGCGIAFTLALVAGAPSFVPPENSVWRELGWFAVAVPLLFAQLVRAVFITLLGIRIISAQVDERTGIDLLDLSPLAPFARVGLRNALFWIVGCTISSLFLFNTTIEMPYLYPVLLAVMVTAIAALVMPIRRIHIEIRRTKRRELARINSEIRRDAQSARSRAPDAEVASGRLPGLIAYRSAIETAREWPLDTPAIARFLLYLGIPLGGWLGGAVAERLLDAIIG